MRAPRSSWRRSGIRRLARFKTVGRTGAWLDLALVVLIDDDSASGAEVLAAALRDNGRAQLIGETTFGTGTVLTTFPQDDGSSVVLATAFWLTPDGDLVWKEGVEPDQFVTLARDAFPSRPEDDPELTEGELEGSADAQLRAAFEALGERPTRAVDRRGWPATGCQRDRGTVAASGLPGRDQAAVPESRPRRDPR